jgi:hypothetical protein
MRKFLLLASAALVFSAAVSAQSTQSLTNVKNTTPAYRRATLEKLTAKVRTQTEEVRHTTMVDATIVPEKIYTYQFHINTGATKYTSRYTPEVQPGEFPQSWVQGNTLVEYRVQKNTLFLKLPQGGELETHIVTQSQAR